MKKNVLFLLFLCFVASDYQLLIGMKRKRKHIKNTPDKSRKKRKVMRHDRKFSNVATRLFDQEPQQPSIPHELIKSNIFPYVDFDSLHTLLQLRLVNKQWKDTVAFYSKQHPLQISITKNKTLEESFDELVTILAGLDCHFSLEFIDCFVVDEDIQNMALLKENLVGLDLMALDFKKEKQITNEGLRLLTDFDKLQSLSLSGFDFITDDGIAHLKKLRNLQTIALCNCKEITDKSMQNLAQLPNLRKVNLSWCHITDKGILKLPKTLTELSIKNCPKITSTGLQHLENRGITVLSN